MVASINPTGKFIVRQLVVWPASTAATVLSWLRGLAWLLGGREWPRIQWPGFLRRCQGFARRVNYRH